MNRDELRNALSGVKSLTISVDDYIYFQELKKEQKPLSFDEHEGDPFFHNCKDTILKYREIINILKDIPLDYNTLKGMSDSEFFNAITNK